MSGPSDKAFLAGLTALHGKAVPPSYVHRVLDAAYPIIREDVIREVVEALRGTSYDEDTSVVDFIEREFGAER